jgi:tRNA uridine 5-carboxymethylaminomethyl modification enzyme
MARQDGDDGPIRFSFFERHARLPQLPCYLTWAGPVVKDIIQRHLSESALYGGAIGGRGPRYCPSVEDKIVKFPDAERHQVFLEPEGLDTNEMYVNGLSTSLPPEVQLEFLRAVPGLEAVQMTRPGYAIEYDYFPPTQLDQTLQVKGCAGLFFAGQINGTTGYEEAAGQGAIAGVNAAAHAAGAEPLVLRRDQAFIGVLVDDLVGRGVDEPYRLFTSRAEYRLLLRQDNALRRLFPTAERLGLLTEPERRIGMQQLEQQDRMLETAGSTALQPEAANPLLESLGASPISEPVRVRELARRHQVSLTELLHRAGVHHEEAWTEWADIEIKYEGYLSRERDSAARLSQMEGFSLPADLPYLEVRSLSYEAREKLSRIRPATIGQAGRIPGVSPSDLQSLILAVLRAR